MLILFAGYLAAHFLVYAVVLRKSDALRSEKGIFLYHFASATLTGLAGCAYVLTAHPPNGFAALVLVLSVHGIYSLSFLELWSLAQGGYSLSVIGSIARAEASLEQIGATKQRERIAGLEKLGLIMKNDGSIILTTRGESVAVLLHGLYKWIAPGDSEAV